MRTKNVNLRSNWRFRREEYLRAADRRQELINEGYEPAPVAAKWTVLPGGRAANRKLYQDWIRLRLVKGANS